MVSQVILMRYISLTIVTINSAMLGLSMRYARTKPGDMFLPTTAVLMNEIVKFFTCLILVYIEEGRSIKKTFSTLSFQVIKVPFEMLKVCVPSLLFIIQNNLLYTAASNLDAATYQVTYQLKILFTGIFSVLILKKKLILMQWIALIMLLIGLTCVQLADTQSKSAGKILIQQNRFLGFFAAVTAGALSGCAGIFFEKILKGSNISVWVRNVQLSFLSLPLGLISVFVYDYESVKKYGFFFGYDGFVIYVIVLQAVGGLIVAMAVKYTDSIIKSFATSLGIIITCIASIYLFNFVLSFQFVLGVAIFISSIYLYNYKTRYSAKILV